MILNTAWITQVSQKKKSIKFCICIMLFMPIIEGKHPLFALQIVKKTCFHFYGVFLNKDLSCAWCGTKLTNSQKSKGCQKGNFISCMCVSEYSLISTDKHVKARTLTVKTLQSPMENCPWRMEWSARKIQHGYYVEAHYLTNYVHWKRRVIIPNISSLNIT